LTIQKWAGAAKAAGSPSRSLLTQCKKDHPNREDLMPESQAGGVPASTPQSDEAREDVLSRAATSTGGAAGTATGQAIQQHDGSEKERLKDLEKPPTPKDAPKAGDFAPHTAQKPIGLQKEEAAYAVNGTIPADMVSSPSGWVPAGAVADREEALERTLESTGRLPDDRELTEDELKKLDGATIRSIAAQRGYEMPAVGGTRSSRMRFLQHQGEDKRFKGSKKDEN
jgi:hypothetical protein